ncbi:hypothetical protein LCGC14_0960390 [marine sediment metagenome]|uniref:Uncharacterized protein n=1 Tax=marine sediment metagenome TaxID=412755 RepID=A0A0F9NEM8_9ZZZZ
MTEKSLQVILNSPINAKMKAEDLIDSANYVVATHEQAEKATDLVKITKICIKKLDAERIAITKPIGDGVKALNIRFKKLSDPLHGVVQKLEALLLAYQQEQNRLAEIERKRIEKEAEERAIADAITAEKAGNIEEADDILDDGADAPAPVMIQPTQQIRGDIGGVGSIRKDWKFEVEDLSKVPIQYVEIKTTEVNISIRQAARAMEAKLSDSMIEIPGLRIYQKEKMNVL